MKEKFENLRENMLIEVSYWNGLGTPYRNYKIITKDKKMYTYEIYLRKVPDVLKEYFDGNEAFYETVINDEEYKMVTNFIKDKIMSKKFDMMNMKDVGYKISVKSGKNIFVRNNQELYIEINDLLCKFYKKNL